MSPLPSAVASDRMLIGVAAISHSGRVRDHALIEALGWAPRDRIVVDPRNSVIILRRHNTGVSEINRRGQVFLPAGARKLLGIADNARVVLVAVTAWDTLLVYPATVVAQLLAHDASLLHAGPVVRRASGAECSTGATFPMHERGTAGEGAS
ncbi:AbrB/MazE/SpoVT family DNA-binding domain-containing protein [Amycolatopsis sp. K13G38]|uniref:AbrB/MazE/SpoVT family DNA-binding domain-containing protein n=1 Tax=Amycolatopsis acididurans TaxID=2724524 RepID=A0ABX1JI19_9PSEU|nr:AbrB/MazE/SpoVT family DNA-binding domain-containing protein [Amycolatopsis acididurans]NKQ59388.1 AbrB/MazE/SpoVT family DNA-binding domain-containing protein [Amycolatopsis acididurans]